MPIAYQGSKQRLAPAILDQIGMPNKLFYDLCCGSGAVSIELVNRGFETSNITMVDAGPWGLFWEAVGSGTFQLRELKYLCNQVPANKDAIKGFIEDLSRQPVGGDSVYVFLLLQAASFGGKAIWIRDNRWQNCSFRTYWQPTAASNRRFPVNPMMPMPETLYKRVGELLPRMAGVHGLCRDVWDVQPLANSVVYIDPPYDTLTGYGHSLNVQFFIAKLKSSSIFVSEKEPLTGASTAVQLSEPRSKGGITGKRKNKNSEYLSLFNRQFLKPKKERTK